MKVDWDELKRLHEAATPGPWSVWDSNSFRRISHKGDGDVICGTIQRSDGHPDLYAKRADLDLLCALRTALPAILAEREAAQTIPPGYALVPVEQVKDARLLAWLLEKHGEQIRQILWSYDQCCSDEINALGVKAMLTAAAKGE